ncbi:MAG: NHLP leader peptide family natural product precursor [Armatimonadetes bacterium]|nr:NHLP leader peptide family natural product precursor [Armatimonadota bacterium]
MEERKKVEELGIDEYARERAMKDPAFRKELLADPKAALQRLLGEELPAELNVRVVEEDANTVYLVLPPASEGPGELSEAELAGVAGGGPVMTRSYGPRPTCWLATRCHCHVAG